VKWLIVLLMVVLLVGCGKDGDYYLREGNACVGRGDMAGAVVQFDRAVEADPDNHEAHNSLGAALSAMGDFTRAIEEFQLAVALNDSFVEGHYNLGRALSEIGRLREALDAFRKATTVDSTYALAYMSAGAVFGSQGMAEQAIDSFERALRFDPNLVQARINLASVYVGLGEYDKGIDQLLLASENQPQNAELMSMAGRTALVKRDGERAIELLTRALEIDSSNLVYRNDLATALMLAGRKDDAIGEWETILEGNPEPGLEQAVRQNLQRATQD
jgi:tetratricopeptide (TPR) repeat protein